MNLTPEAKRIIYEALGVRSIERKPMRYCIKRTYNRHGDHDYLIALDPEWVTSCAGFRSPDIIQYPNQAEAEAVVTKLTEDYALDFPGSGHKFAAVPFPPSN